MGLILGIDPGAHKGVATSVGGQLTVLETVGSHQIERLIRRQAPARVVFDDSRLQAHSWTSSACKAAAVKMARNVSQVDAWCNLITAVCAELGFTAHGISPAGKGAKLNAASPAGCSAATSATQPWWPGSTRGARK